MVLLWIYYFLSLVLVFTIPSYYYQSLFHHHAEFVAYLKFTIPLIIPLMVLINAMNEWSKNFRQKNLQSEKKQEQHLEMERQKEMNNRKRVRPYFVMNEDSLRMYSLGETPITNVEIAWKEAIEQTEIRSKIIGGLNSNESFLVPRNFRWLIIKSQTYEFETVYAVLSRYGEVFHFVLSNKHASKPEILNYELKKISLSSDNIHEYNAYTILLSSIDNIGHNNVSSLTTFTNDIRWYVEKNELNRAASSFIYLIRNADLSKSMIVSSLRRIVEFLENVDDNNTIDKGIQKYFHGNLQPFLNNYESLNQVYKYRLDKWSTDFKNGDINNFTMRHYTDDIVQLYESDYINKNDLEYLLRNTEVYIRDHSITLSPFINRSILERALRDLIIENGEI